MLPKKNRVDRKGVNLLFKEGKSLVSPILSFRFIIKSTKSPAQISFTTPKSIAKLAVIRNKLRRRGYTAVQKHLNNFPSGIMGVFVFRKYEDDVSKIEQDIKSFFNRIR